MHAGKLPGNYAADLLKLAHQVFLVMQAARRVAQEQVAVLRPEGSDRIEHHGGRIRPLAVLHDRHACALRPNGQLLCRGRAEGVRRSHHGLAPLGFIIRSHLADGSRFSYAVHAHDQDHGRLPFRKESLLRPHAFGKDARKRFPRFGPGLQLLLGNGFLQPFEKFFRCSHPHIGHDHRLFQFIVKRSVDPFIPREQACEHAAARSRKALLQFFKKALLFFHDRPSLSRTRYAISLNRADTIFDMPRSSIATP